MYVLRRESDNDLKTIMGARSVTKLRVRFARLMRSIKLRSLPSFLIRSYD